MHECMHVCMHIGMHFHQSYSIFLTDTHQCKNIIDHKICLRMLAVLTSNYSLTFPLSFHFHTSKEFCSKDWSSDKNTGTEQGHYALVPRINREPLLIWSD